MLTNSRVENNSKLTPENIGDVNLTFSIIHPFSFWDKREILFIYPIRIGSDRKGEAFKRCHRPHNLK